MAHYTREQARDTAKVVKQKKDFTILIAYRTDTGVVFVKTYQNTNKELSGLIGAMEAEFPEQVMVISGETLKPRLEGLTSIKGIEDVLYQTVNATIKEKVVTRR